MSRMHSRRRGSSGSTKPQDVDTSWVKYDTDEVEQLVEKLATQGKGPAEIGSVLRDRYGIPDIQAVTGRTVTDILDELDAGSEIPADLYSLMEAAVRIDDHLQRNDNDQDAKRRLSLTEAKIRRLIDYYRGDELPEDYSYSLEKARLQVE